MRDSKRIYILLAYLGEYWHQHPDLRLCQIIGNFVDEHWGRGMSCPEMSSRAYNTEDTELLEYLQGKLSNE